MNTMNSAVLRPFGAERTSAPAKTPPPVMKLSGYVAGAAGPCPRTNGTRRTSSSVPLMMTPHATPARMCQPTSGSRQSPETRRVQEIKPSGQKRRTVGSSAR